MMDNETEDKDECEKQYSDLKKSRSTAKGLLTRKRNSLRAFLLSGDNLDLTLVNDKVNEIVEAFSRFKQAHETLIDFMTAIDDFEAVEEALMYFEVERNLVKELYSKVEGLQPQPVKDKPSDNEIDHEVTPGDSVSQVSSKASRTSLRSTTSSYRERLLDETLRRESLEARLKMHDKQRTLEERRKLLQEQESQLREDEQLIRIQTDLAESKAREAVLARFVQVSVDSSASQCERQPGLFPNASEGHNIGQHVADDQRNNSNNNRTAYGQPVFENKYNDSTSLEKIVQQQQANALVLSLPQMEVPVFTGDPTEYCYFVNAFDNMIANKTSDYSRKLYYLVQFTTGEVQELMKSCLAKEPKSGYEEARKILKKRYGQDYKIASALVDSLIHAPPIKSDDVKGLQSLSVLMTSCKNTLDEIGYSSRMENPDSLKRLISRLPYDMRRQWRKIADDISENKEREIRFCDIVEFVNREVRVIHHPIFGDISDKKQEATHSKTNESSERIRRPQRSYGSAFAVQSSNETKRCPLCYQDHPLQKCQQFLNKSVEERAEVMKRKGLCFNCLAGPGLHLARYCEEKPACAICNRKHDTLLHFENESTSFSTATNGYIRIPGVKNLIPNNGVGLPIVPVKVKGKESSEVLWTYAFLDPGSTSTFCSDELMKALKIAGKKTRFSLTTIEKERSVNETYVTELEVFSVDDKYFTELPTVFSRTRLPISLSDRHSQEDLEHWSYLKGLPLPDVYVDPSKSTGRVDLLIGGDNCQAFEPKEVRPSRDGGPFAIRTMFGWVVNGPLGRRIESEASRVNYIRADKQLSTQFEDFCNREFSDTLCDVNLEMSQDDKRALEIMNESVSLTNGHYQLSLPFRENPPVLPNNKVLAEHRLQLLRRRLERDDNLLLKYAEFMDKLEEKDYAERVPQTTLQHDQVWYLPHHPVINPKKPDKLRVVFDCSAKYKGESLNDKLLQGPDLTNSLVGVLTRFRQGPIALMSDVETMFYQVRVTPNQRDALRYLWWPDHDLSSPPQEFRMKVHLFGASSSPSCCNFALKKTAEDNEGEFGPDVKNTVYRNFYVDDCLKSVETIQQAKEMVTKLSACLAKGGFHLTKWLSNCQSVNEEIPESERSKTVKELVFGEVKVERALGILWDINHDQFTFQVTLKDKPTTRRGILSIMSSVYDPLGFVSPVLLPVKSLLQDLCRDKYDWDQTIPDDKRGMWNEWIESLPKLQAVQIPRCLKPTGFSSIVTAQLHHFSDASETGYGAVSYLRLEDKTGRIHCSFLISKSRVAPAKTISIPRLELSAATVSIRLDHMMRSELELRISQSYFWTDSTSVLKYVNNTDKRFHTFVANRISQILCGSKCDQWKFIDGKSNPADEASRGLSVNALLENDRWKFGPSFLWGPEAEWPEQETHKTIFDPQVDDLEVKKDKKVFASLIEKDTCMTTIFSKFSSWQKLKKCIAWVLRYKSNLKFATLHKNVTPPVKARQTQVSRITVNELREAEKAIIMCLQHEHFPDEIRQLSSLSLCGKSSCIRKLDPFVKDGLLRVGGRLHRSTLTEDSKHPLILPRKNHVTDVIIRYFHEVTGHVGREQVLAEIRRKFWIPKGGAAVRGVITKCVQCRRRHAPVAQQKMSNLPKDRLSPDHPPFSCVGIDFFGPFSVKRGRSHEKRYGCVFTCLSSRAIHLEVTNSLSTDSFMNALCRFIARRGSPNQIRSDNGGCFISAAKEIKAEIAKWNEDKLHEFLLQKEIQWLFNPPTASHFGGVWERCIRSIRRILNALLNEQVLDDEGLSSLMCEVESILNNRPLTKLTDDPNDLEVLTPNHLILMRSSASLPLGTFRKEDCYVKRRWRQVQYLSDQFWKRWVKEYLPLLQERNKWLSIERNLTKGDIVLLVDNNAPRHAWPLGIIIETFCDEFGHVRKVKLKTKSSTTCERPVHKCVLLEVNHAAL